VAGGPADVLLEINGVTVGPSFTAPEETGTWDLWARMWDSGTDEVADIRLYNTDLSWYPNDFYVDDIFFVPEPVSFWLVCLGGTALLRKRRSRSLTCLPRMIPKLNRLATGTVPPGMGAGRTASPKASANCLLPQDLGLA